MGDYNNIFNLLASDNYYELKKTSDRLINDEAFLNQIITVSNPFVFDRFTKIVQYKMDTAKLCEARNSYIKKIILNNEKLKERWLVEDIISYFFQDNYYNFVTNMLCIINYLNPTKKELIEKDHLNIYNEFVNLVKLNNLEKRALFKKYCSRDDLMAMFYDDISIIRNDSHKELVNQTIKLNKDSDIYCQDLTRRLGIDTYYLDGKEFYGFVRCFSINRNDLSDHSDYVYSKENCLGYSFSYIGDNNIGTIDYSGKNVVLFYDNIDYQNIMYVHHADLHTKKMQGQDDYLSEKENEILLPDSLIGKTNNYNEIFIKGNNIKPTALICYDAISGNDIAFAKKYDLAILVINREKYKRYEKFDEDYGSYQYSI